MKALVLDTGTGTAHAVAAARALAESVDVVFAAGDAPSPEACAAALAAGARDYDVVCAAADALGRSALPRAAALSGVDMQSDVVAIRDGKLVRPIHAGRALASFPVTAPLFFTARIAAFPAEPSGTWTRREWAPERAIVAARPVRAASSVSGGGRDLANAAKVVGVGRGAAASTLLPSIEVLADVLQAARAATRPAIDAGAAPEAALVGQSGRSIAPDFYLALGISGALQHFAGVRDAKIIAAINSDPSAPIFEWADYGWVADLETALPELIAALQRP